MTMSPAEKNQNKIECSETLSMNECSNVQKETATDINTAGTKVEQSCLKSDVEMTKAKELIRQLADDFDGIIKITKSTGGYRLAPNEFVYNYPNTAFEVKQEMVVAYEPDTKSFTIRNGNIGGKSLFSSVEYRDLLNTQVSYLNDETTKLKTCSNMQGVECRDNQVTIEFTKKPKPCKAIQDVVNNYNVLMVLPGMDNNECCFQNVVTPTHKPCYNRVRYENGCYRGHMIHENQRIDYNFPEQEFAPFLSACGGRLDLNALTANQFATCTTLPQPMCNFRDTYPQYVTPSVSGFDLKPNQYAICNTFEPTQYNSEKHEYDCMSFRKDVFPVAQYDTETDTHQVIIRGESCHFRQPEMLEFLEAYNADCKEEIKNCDIERGDRYIKQYVDEKYENKAYKKLLKSKKIEQQAKADYKNTADEQRVEHQSLIDTYNNLLAACEDPSSRKMKRAKKKIEKYEKKMAKRAEREEKQLERRLKKAERYKAKACKIAQDGLDDLEKDRAKNLEKFKKDLDKKRGIKKKKDKKIDK